MCYIAINLILKVMSKKLLFGFGVTMFLLLGAGCGGQTVGPDGGVLKSTDAGAQWASKSAVLTASGQKVSFNTVDVFTLVIDPSDAQAMWAGTSANGIFYTFDGGEGWLMAKKYAPSAANLMASRVNAIAVDPTNSCIVYATTVNPANQSFLMRTLNCGRSWLAINSNELGDRHLTSIAINPMDRLQIFLGNSVGDIFRSDNAGGSWTKLTRFEDKRIRAIVVHPKKKGVVYSATALGGLRRSADSGKTWTRVDSDKFGGMEDVFSIAIDTSKDDALLVGTEYGILRSENGGGVWEPLTLLTAPRETNILSLALNPRNPNMIYYGACSAQGTGCGFYRSSDAGKSWNTKQVPSSRLFKTLLVQSADVANAQGQKQELETIWLGTWRNPQQ